MPATDRCEPPIIHAIEKAGWKITHHPFAIKINRSRGGYVYADARFEQSQNKEQIIVVEVKCFDSNRTVLEEFYHAVGQYVVYRNALLTNEIETPVYLAIPSKAYDEFFNQQLIQSVVTDIQLQLIVIDLEKEEVRQWITLNR